ncbi:hypothetical protein M0R04_11425 [Candidatus Dojkabacteria bacterium]|jgi:hypothetical protein|nr:hypothetical protein [Candidatus Dojkabacteria bacterium]
MIKLILFSLLLCSCGKIKVETNKLESDPVNFGPDFKAASEICDARYGVKTQESDDCFKDYRTYLSPKISFDLGSITDFCNKTYANPSDVSGCTDDLLGIIEGLNLNKDKK